MLNLIFYCSWKIFQIIFFHATTPFHFINWSETGNQSLFLTRKLRNMTRITVNKVLLRILSFLLIYLISPQTIQAQEVQHYVVEPNHSSIGFSIPIAGGVSRVTGKFTQFLITLDYVDSNLSKSSFRAEIKVGSINTGIERRDNHLKRPDFFDAEKFPEIIFQSNTIKKTEDGYLVNGELTMHGITKSIEIPLEFKGSVDRYLAFEAKSSLLRSDYEVGTDYVHPGFPDFLSNKVDFTFSFWAMGPIPDNMWEEVKRKIKDSR